MATSFGPKQDFATGIYPSLVMAADVNRDGKLDLIVSIENTVSVLLGNGDGTFAIKQQDSLVRADPGGLTTADVNRDGKLDLITLTDQGSGSAVGGLVSVYLGNGDGTFAAYQDFPVARKPESVTTADLNGDGKLDLIVAGMFGNVSALLGNGDGTFAAGQGLTTGTYDLGEVTTADVNRDGKPDVIVVDWWRQTGWVLLGNGNGTFATNQVFTTRGLPHSVTTADVNGDGKLDLITDGGGLNPDTGWDTAAVLLGNGNGTFGAEQHFVAGRAVDWARAADVNGDGKLDLVVVDENSNAVSVLLGNGDGTFAAKQDFATGDLPTSVTIADVNRDGKLDLIAADAYGDTVSVLLGYSTGEISAVSASAVFGSVVGPGGTITFTLSSQSPVAVSGHPVLTLSNNETAYYTGMDGSNRPVFSYTVQSGHDTSDLTVTGLNLNGGIITQLAQTSFAAKQDFTTGWASLSATTADLDGDGKLDLIAADSYTNAVSVLLGNGNGTFAAKHDFTTGVAPRSVTTADVNGDGKLDLIVATFDNAVSVLLGNGDGTLAAKQDFSTGSSSVPTSVTTADVNGDGKLDVITANTLSGNGSLLLGNGDGTFGAHQDFTTGNNPRSVTTADVNGDGKLDLITAGDWSDTVSVLLGNGDGTFAAKQDFTTGSISRSVTAADVNRDGKVDLITADYNSNAVSVLLGNGNGTFAAHQDFTTGVEPTSAATADVNGDGKLDLIVANYLSNTVSVLLGNGDGTFADKQDFTTGSSPNSVTTGDVNRDGKPDLIVADDSGSTVSVLLNSSSTATSFRETTSLLNVPGADTGLKIDTQAPSTPAAPVLAHDTGAAGDGITSDPTIIYPTAAPGDTLLYKLDNGSYGTTAPTLGTDGSADGQHTVSVEERDTGGNISAASTLTFTLDTQAPSTPAAPVLAHDTGWVGTDRITRDPTIIYPTAAPDDTLLYKLDNGSYGTTAPTLATDGTADGQHTVSVEERDSAGNISAASSLTFTLDTQAPSTPAAPVLVHDTGVAGDGITSDPTIIYPTAVPGNRLFYNGGDAFAGPTWATDGSADGQHWVTLEEIDRAGNTSAASSLTFTLDTRAPSPPAAPVLAHDTGVAGDGITSDPTITYPTAASDDTLLYKLDNGSYGTTAPTLATDGSADGQHTVSIEERDSAGNISAASRLTFMLDTTAPASPTSLADGAVVAGLVNAAHNTSAQTLTGAAEAGSTVTIYDNGSQFGTPVIADASTGKWSLTLGSLTDGPHSLTAVATDAAGNTGQASTALAFRVDTHPPVSHDHSYTLAVDAPLTIGQDQGVLSDATDVGAAGLTAHVESGPTHGSLSFNADGSFVYTPAATFYGTDTFSFKANDGAQDGGPNAVWINVTRPTSSQTSTDPSTGTSSTTTYDAQGNQPWSQQTHNFDSNGHETSATVSYWDGSLQGATFDANNDQPWSSQNSVTNAQGQVTNMGVFYDDGTQQTAIYDADNNQPWLSQHAVYDALGRQTTLGVIYDDGTQQTAIFDAANNQLWSSQNMVYDAHGHVTNVGVIYDDLHTETAVYDVHSDQPWTSQSAVYDPSGNLIATSVSYDDGHVENWHI